MDIFKFLQLVLGGFVLLHVIAIIILVFYLIALWNLYKKVGRYGWEAIIPFYSNWVLGEIAGVAWWYPIIIIIFGLDLFEDDPIDTILTLATFVSNFFIMYNLSKKFHKGTGFAILATIFPIVLVPIMAFSNKYQYDKNVLVSKNGPIGDNFDNTTSNNNNSIKYCQNCGNQIDINAKFCSKCGNELK